MLAPLVGHETNDAGLPAGVIVRISVCGIRKHPSAGLKPPSALRHSRALALPPVLSAWQPSASWFWSSSWDSCHPWATTFRNTNLPVNKRRSSKDSAQTECLSALPRSRVSDEHKHSLFEHRRSGAHWSSNARRDYDNR
jgi:hypothetical protein